jgi:ADP-dependent NAD(P)H-hydrate dehydratase / NAD(P)H-hydrate epimerase
MALKLVTSESMRQTDRQAIDKEGIPSLTLMENAGRGVAERILADYLTDTHSKRAVVMCGTGNNGGDGFVVARYLYQAGADVSCILVGDESRLSSECAHNYNLAKDLHIPIVHVASPDTLPSVLQCDIIIDALCGTGFSGSARGLMADAIHLINNCKAIRIAIDIPSGVNADNGACEGGAVTADLTCTLALPKIGLFVSPGREHAGQVEIIPIGIPSRIIDECPSPCELITSEDVASFLPKRKPDGHKFDFGTLLIVGGSTGLTGAVALAGESALRTGCGMARIACPAAVLPIIAQMIREATTIPLPDAGKRGAFALRGLGDLRKAANENSAVVIGPGIGRHHETMELVRRFVVTCERPLVVDADSLNAFEGHSDLLAKSNSPRVLTPHSGEFKRLTGEITAQDIHERIAQTTRWAKKFSSVMVLKGSPTLIASPDGACFLNPTGNNGMATGGSGDVLSGIIGSLLAQGMTPLEAAVTGTYLHGLAGDIVAESIGVRSLIAGDLVSSISDAFHAVECAGRSPIS